MMFCPHLQYAGVNIGPVHKKDVMKASAMLERDNQCVKSVVLLNIIYFLLVFKGGQSFLHSMLKLSVKPRK